MTKVFSFFFINQTTKLNFTFFSVVVRNLQIKMWSILIFIKKTEFQEFNMVNTDFLYRK